MKKVLKVLSSAMLVAAVAASAATVASAAGLNSDEQRVMDELNTSVNMAGVETFLTDSYKNQVENYLLQDDVDLTAEQADNVIAKVEETKSFIEGTGVAHFDEMSADQFNQFAGLVKDAAAAGLAEVTVTRTIGAFQHPADVALVNKGGNGGNNGGNNGGANGANGANGGNGGFKTPIDNNPIKTTGFDVPSVTAVAGVGILMVSAAGIYLFKTSKKESVDA